MELRHIRYFLAIAETRNFTRAAAQLGMGQPPLSLQIKDLEEEIGTRLFHRIPRGVELTEAGMAFFEAVRTLPDQAQMAIQVARKAGKGESGVLRLGITGTAAFNPIISESIRQFQYNYPQVVLSLEECYSSALVSGLEEGRLDAAIIRPTRILTDNLEVHDISTEELIVALPKGHKLATREQPILLTELRHEPMIMTPRALALSLYESIVTACREAGFEPVIGQSAQQIVSTLLLVSADMGVSLVPKSVGLMAGRGVVFRPLAAPVPKVSLSIAYRKNSTLQTMQNFTAILQQVALQY